MEVLHFCQNHYCCGLYRVAVCFAFALVVAIAAVFDGHLHVAVAVEMNHDCMILVCFELLSIFWQLAAAMDQIITFRRLFHLEWLLQLLSMMLRRYR